MNQPLRMILIGPPGAGKGTQARRLVDKYGIVAISAGDLFRARTKDPNDPLGNQIKAILDSGKLVPDEITIQMISERLDQPDCKNGFVLDGFPRSVAQAEALEKMLETKGMKLNTVIQMEVNDEDLIDRISGRFSCSKCGEGYHDSFKQPKTPNKCDGCGAGGAPFSRRSDDNEDTVRQRLETYHSQTAPILPFYDKLNVLKRVDGMGSMAQVAGEIDALLVDSGGSDKHSPPKMGS